MLYLGIHVCTYISMHLTINEKRYHEYDKKEGIMESLEGSKGSKGKCENIYNLKN